MAKQQSLPGVGPKQIPEIEEAATRLRKIRSQRQTLAEEEEKAQAFLVEVLKKNGFRKGRAYQFEDDSEGEPVKLDVLLDQKDPRAYVRKHKEPKAEEESGEGSGEGSGS
jgi:hypothetical protein